MTDLRAILKEHNVIRYKLLPTGKITPTGVDVLVVMDDGSRIKSCRLLKDKSGSYTAQETKVWAEYKQCEDIDMMKTLADVMMEDALLAPDEWTFSIEEIIEKLSLEADSKEADIDAILEFFGQPPLGWNEAFNGKVSARYFESWLCTDTTVGKAIIYFDNKAVALQEKINRKTPTVIRLLRRQDPEPLIKFKEFCLSFSSTKIEEVSYIDLDASVYFDKLRQTMPRYKNVLLGL